MAVIVLIILTASLITIMNEFASTDDYSYQDTSDLQNGGQEGGSVSFAGKDCNVAGIELHGNLVTYISYENLDDQGYPTTDETASENIIGQIKDAEKAKNIKAIILEVDSYGGYPVAAEEVAEALKRAAKPTVALIREGGVSAAYWAATGADTIFADKNSDVGSIGVTMSYLDYSEQNKKEGIQYIELSSSKYKTTGDPNRPLSEEEKKILMRDVQILHENFVQDVATNRKLDINKVKELADGSSVLGQTALELGLIDKIGGFYDVKDYLKEKIDEEVKTCW